MILPQSPPLEIEFVRAYTLGRSSPEVGLFLFGKFSLKSGCNLLCQVALDGEYVFHLPVVRRTPESVVSPCIVKDRDNLDPIFDALDAALQKRTDAQLG